MDDNNNNNLSSSSPSPYPSSPSPSSSFSLPNNITPKKSIPTTAITNNAITNTNINNNNGLSINWLLVSTIKPLTLHISSYTILESMTMYLVLKSVPTNPELTKALRTSLARFDVNMVQLAETEVLMLSTASSVAMGSVLYGLVKENVYGIIEFEGTRFERLRKIREMAAIATATECELKEKEEEKRLEKGNNKHDDNDNNGIKKVRNNNSSKYVVGNEIIIIKNQTTEKSIKKLRILFQMLATCNEIIQISERGIKQIESVFKEGSDDDGDKDNNKK